MMGIYIIIICSTINTRLEDINYTNHHYTSFQSLSIYTNYYIKSLFKNYWNITIIRVVYNCIYTIVSSTIAYLFVLLFFR